MAKTAAMVPRSHSRAITMALIMVDAAPTTMTRMPGTRYQVEMLASLNQLRDASPLTGPAVTREAAAGSIMPLATIFVREALSWPRT